LDKELIDAKNRLKNIWLWFFLYLAQRFDMFFAHWARRHALGLKNLVASFWARGSGALFSLSSGTG
jgi:hypothetical protein